MAQRPVVGRQRLLIERDARDNTVARQVPDVSKQIAHGVNGR